MGNNTQSKTVLMREFSSGGVVYKKIKENKKELWLVRKTSASEIFPRSYWMLPKGWIDDAGKGVPGPMASGKIRADETSLRQAAIREVSEEAGIEAKIIKKIGTMRYKFTHPKKGQILKFVTFYLMEWEKDLSEGFDFETSEIAWLPFEEALKTLSFSAEKEMLKEAKAIF